MKNKEVKQVKVSETQREAAGYYKGYDIYWLRKHSQHPDFKFVAEFDAKKAKEKK